MLSGFRRVLAPRDGATAVDGGRRWRREPRWRPGRDALHLLAAMVGGGIAIDEALEALADASSGTARSAPARASQLIRSGTSPSVAFRAVGAESHVVALVHSGERAGDASSALRAAGDVSGRLERMRSTVRGALVYPAVVLAVGLAMVTVIAVLVVPPLERTFVELGGDLPQLTRAVLAASAFVRRGGVLLVLVGALAARGLLRRAGTAGRWVAADRVPMIGGFRSDVDLAVLARMLAALLGAGVPLDESLHASAAVLEEGRVQRAVERTADLVARGGSSVASDGLGALIGGTDRALLEVGERSGLLAAQWAQVADRRAGALDARVQRVGSVLEPLLVVAVGLVVGGAVLALYLPTFRILDLV